MMNYHFHDHASSDGARPLREHAAAAAAAGFREICVTNHVEALRPDGSWDVELDEALRRFEAELAAVEAARGEFPELRIRFGAEFAFRPAWTRPLERLAREMPFDFVLGSLHEVDGIDVSGPHADAFFAGRPARDTYGRYVEALGDLVAWGAFDAVAHFDLVKRYGHRTYGDVDPAEVEDRARPVLAAMARAGIGIETNTSGVVQLPRVPYPDTPVLAWAREEGVPFLTVGSDSHAPEHFGQGIGAGLDAARTAGWEALTTFAGRRPAGTIPLAAAGANGGSEGAAGGADRRTGPAGGAA
ncbi:MAG: histidinol-phosphatase HisJ family protein [Gemmatimonadota bacterium]|nr:histidinol-phosphatase HisJ family protein [Gemmatimonadota bacterium]